MQHRLKAVDRLEPREILNVAERFREIPGDYRTIRQFLDIMRSGHPRFEEYADCGSTIDWRAGRPC